MKRTIIFSVIMGLVLQSCKKSIEPPPLTSSLLFVNGAINISNARVYASLNAINWKELPTTDAAAFTRSVYMGASAGLNNIRVVSAADTTLVLFGSTKPEEFSAGRVNTLFLCGNTGAYEGVVIIDDKTPNYSDSVLGIRFINLSPNSNPVNITLSISPTVNEASGLAYKQITNFKVYPSLANTAAMVFQVRDAGGALLASYTLPIVAVSPYTTVGIPYARFKNLTLVVKGLQGTTSGTNAFGIFPVAHY